MGPGFILTHDNAKAHTAAITKGVLTRLKIQVMDWPANNPDLNPIVWDMLDRHSSSSEMLSWKNGNGIHKATFTGFFQSMQWRCQKAINARGDPIIINSFHGPSKLCINCIFWHLCHKNYDVINQVTAFITEFYNLPARQKLKFPP